jgi:hypothetical protein
LSFAAAFHSGLIGTMLLKMILSASSGEMAPEVLFLNIS